MLIYLYTFYRKVIGRPFFQRLQIASHREFEVFYEKLSQLLQQVGFEPRDGMVRFLSRVRRTFSYLPMESRDVGVLMTILEAVERRLQDLEAQSRERR